MTRAIWLLIACVLLAYPLIQAGRHSPVALANTLLCLVGAGIAIAIVVSRGPQTRFSWLAVLGAGIAGSLILGTLGVLLFPILGPVHAYGVRHGGIPPRLAEQRFLFDAAAGLGRGLATGAVFSLAALAFLKAFGLLHRASSVDDFRLRKGDDPG